MIKFLAFVVQIRQWLPSLADPRSPTHLLLIETITNTLCGGREMVWGLQLHDTGAMPCSVRSRDIYVVVVPEIVSLL